MDDGYLGSEFGEELGEPVGDTEADRLRKQIEMGSMKPPAPKAASTRDAAQSNDAAKKGLHNPSNRVSETLDQIAMELNAERHLTDGLPRDSI